MVGKTKRPKHKRGTPYDRRTANAMEVDEAPPAKPLSAHKQRTAERKRLQREVAVTKLQRRKLREGSKADRKRAKKELSRKIKAVEQHRQSIQRSAAQGQVPMSMDAGVSPAPVPGFTFDLPPVVPGPKATDAPFSAFTVQRP